MESSPWGVGGGGGVRTFPKSAGELRTAQIISAINAEYWRTLITKNLLDHQFDLHLVRQIRNSKTINAENNVSLNCTPFHKTFSIISLFQPGKSLWKYFKRYFLSKPSGRGYDFPSVLQSFVKYDIGNKKVLKNHFGWKSHAHIFRSSDDLFIFNLNNFHDSSDVCLKSLSQNKRKKNSVNLYPPWNH